MSTLAGPHCPRPPPQAFLFTKNIHCRHLPGAWVTMGWVCFLGPSRGRNFLTRKGMSKKRSFILVCVQAMCMYTMYVYAYSCMLCHALLSRALSYRHPDKPRLPLGTIPTASLRLCRGVNTSRHHRLEKSPHPSSIRACGVGPRVAMCQLQTWGLQDTQYSLPKKSQRRSRA